MGQVVDGTVQEGEEVEEGIHLVEADTLQEEEVHHHQILPKLSSCVSQNGIQDMSEVSL